SNLVLTRREHPLASYRLPTANDWRAWGDIAAQATATATAASPEIAQLSDDELDRALIDGAVTALDRFSLYLTPEEARQSAIIEDGPVGPSPAQPTHSGGGLTSPRQASAPSSAISAAPHPLPSPSVQFRMDG